MAKNPPKKPSLIYEIHEIHTASEHKIYKIFKTTTKTMFYKNGQVKKWFRFHV